MTTTIEVPAGLSNLLSAYDDAHWETVVAELKPGSGVLARGAVLSAVAADAGKLTLTTASRPGRGRGRGTGRDAAAFRAGKRTEFEKRRESYARPRRPALESRFPTGEGENAKAA
jgi:hypothetical protein